MYDAIVIGLGGMGAAALAALARRGRRVLGLEQLHLGHTHGSSHGHTRVIRTAYYEHPAYVPLCRQAFVAWRDLERRTGRRLLVACPCLSIGQPHSELIAGVARAAAEHSLPVESLSPADLRRRFPQFRFDDSYVGLLEFEAGFLYVDDCVRALLDDAVATGAELRASEPVSDWRVDADGVAVHTPLGVHRATRLVITAGPWTRQLLDLPLTVMRQVVFWFNPPNRFDFELGRFPVFMADTPEGCFYGIPATGDRGLKIARHYGAPELPGPHLVERAVTAEDEGPIREFLRAHLPSADVPRQEASVCLYTLTPDRHFVIDRHPQFASVAVAGGFSGHGFKFAPVVGELLADLTDDVAVQAPELFRIARLSASMDVA